MRRGDEFKCQDLNPREDTKTNRQTDEQDTPLPRSLLTLRGRETQLRLHTPARGASQILHWEAIQSSSPPTTHSLFCRSSGSALRPRTTSAAVSLPTSSWWTCGWPPRSVPGGTNDKKKRGHKTCNKCLSDILTEVFRCGRTLFFSSFCFCLSSRATRRFSALSR